VKTGGYGGKSISKGARVKTNDTGTPEHILTMTGRVEKFADISPRFLRMVGMAGQPLSSSVTITPEKKYDFKITKASAVKGTHIKVSLSPRPEGTPGYIVSVENLKKTMGRYYDTVVLKTDSKLKPVIRIKVYGNIIKSNKKGTI
jgi:hypothetical protein